MAKTKFNFDEEIELYYSIGYKYDYLLWGLIANADRIINSVYIFKHFEEYCKQLNSDRNEDKKEVYWNASYHEKLIDFIKIVVAFETFNKAKLIKNGVLIHKIDPKFHKGLAKRQSAGIPITLDEFYNESYTNLNWRNKEANLNGLVNYYPTINFSHTLNKNYQEILKLDEILVSELDKINHKRNRLHFYSDFRGTFEVSRHIDKWKYIKEISKFTIRQEFELINKELEQFD